MVDLLILFVEFGCVLLDFLCFFYDFIQVRAQLALIEHWPHNVANLSKGHHPRLFPASRRKIVLVVTVFIFEFESPASVKEVIRPKQAFTRLLSNNRVSLCLFLSKLVNLMLKAVAPLSKFTSKMNQVLLRSFQFLWLFLIKFLHLLLQVFGLKSDFDFPWMLNNRPQVILKIKRKSR